MKQGLKEAQVQGQALERFAMKAPQSPSTGTLTK